MSDLDRWSKFCAGIAILIVVVLIGKGIAEFVLSSIALVAASQP